VKIVVSGHN